MLFDPSISYCCHKTLFGRARHYPMVPEVCLTVVILTIPLHKFGSVPFRRKQGTLFNFPISQTSLHESWSSRFSYWAGLPTMGNGEGGLVSDVGIKALPKSWAFVVRSKITLRNPLSPNSARAVKLAAAGMVFAPYLISCVKPSQRMMDKGRMMMQYAIGYL